MTRSRITTITLLSIMIATSAFADGVGDAARAVLAANEDSVVVVKLVIKQEMSYGGRQGMKQESKSEAIGTVIDPSGLCVVSLASTDPAGTMRRIMGNMSFGQENKMEFNTELTDITIILPGKKEVDGEVVLRDRDLDLAFVRPTEALPEPCAAVDPKKATKPRVLDEVVLLSRLGKVANRVTSVTLDRVSAAVDRPREFFVLNQDGAGYGLGSPAFTMDAQPIGIIVLRSIETEASGGWGAALSGSSNMGLLPILLPYDSVMESAEQVPPRKTESK